MLVAYFVAGFFGIQIVSRFLHQYIPSHVVDCDHSHDDLHSHSDQGLEHHHNSDGLLHNHSTKRTASSRPEVATESTPLIATTGPIGGDELAYGDAAERLQGRPAIIGVGADGVSGKDSTAGASRRRLSTAGTPYGERRPSMALVQQRVISFVKDSKANCDEGGPCYGFSDPCGLECRKHTRDWSGHSRPGPTAPKESSTSVTSGYRSCEEAAPVGGDGASSGPEWTSRAQSSETEVEEDDGPPTCSHASDVEAQQHHQQHHHHVPRNAFLSIGLQTCIAITLHKFPEGFITYATNHANPVLGLNVFTALFVHNITEGFTLALPLYMALGSRMQAMVWASLLGGLSQPAGAAIAALWFHLAKRTEMQLDETVYACLFCVTAGIMVSVALELFAESLSLNHSRNLSIFCAFIGMVILGLSNAFVGGH
jgi:zinc transporter, ZIP family